MAEKAIIFNVQVADSICNQKSSGTAIDDEALRKRTQSYPIVLPSGGIDDLLQHLHNVLDDGVNTDKDGNPSLNMLR